MWKTTQKFNLRRLGKHNKVRQNLSQCMEIAYINLNGQASKYWDEIKQTVMHKEWGTVMFMETHWRGKFKGKLMGIQEAEK